MKFSRKSQSFVLLKNPVYFREEEFVRVNDFNERIWDGWGKNNLFIVVQKNEAEFKAQKPYETVYSDVGVAIVNLPGI